MGKKKQRILGSFEHPEGSAVFGEIVINGPKTLISLHSERKLGAVLPGQSLNGTTRLGERVSLIDCAGALPSYSYQSNRPTIYGLEIFPHFVSVGTRTLVPENPCIQSVQFCCRDLPTLFYDFDAFGIVMDAKPVIDAVLQERRKLRPVEIGEMPLVWYFSGKNQIVDVKTAIGNIVVSHRPAYGTGGPRGFNVRNRIVTEIRFPEPLNLLDAVGHIRSVICFLSLAAGRVQQAHRILLVTVDPGTDSTRRLSVYPSFPIGSENDKNLHKPAPSDLPFDPIRKADEFEKSLAHWIDRHVYWRSARWRCVECLGNGNAYTVDRLVAAANMFELLPKDAKPKTVDLDPSISEIIKTSITSVKALPISENRNSALNSLNRIGQLSLRMIINSRLAIVEKEIGDRFRDLDLVIKLAVGFRNYFVHGSDDFDYGKFEGYMPFCTDALEFVFTASDMIEAGWDAKKWALRDGGYGHSFSRFRSSYRDSIDALRKSWGT